MCLKPAEELYEKVGRGIDLRTLPRPTESDAYKALLLEIETGDKGMMITCPHCGEKAHVRTSRPMGKLVRHGLCYCTNVLCGHTFKVATEVIGTISPSAFPDPEVEMQLPMLASLQERHPPKGAPGS